MRIDVIIGNPPYNRTDVQMKFALLAYEISRYSSMIIPAKWQVKNDRTKEYLYNTFRDTVVSHIKEIVYWVDSADIFMIGELSGVSIYVAYKDKEFDTKLIDNRCMSNEYINGIVDRQFIGFKDSLNNNGQVIINKINYTMGKFKPSEYNIDKQYQFWCNALITGVGDFNIRPSGLDRIMSTKTGKLQLLSSGEVLKQGDKSSADSYNLLYSSNSIDEVVSYMSYIYTKFTRYLIFNSICGLRSTGQDAWWRFVPNQIFDHIYSDEELYKRYNLSEYDIEVIENTIANREFRQVLSWIPLELRDRINLNVLAYF